MAVRSRFGAKRRYISVNKAPLSRAASYDLSAGLDTFTANELLAENASPYLRNARLNFRGTMETRKGEAAYSVPVGETVDSTQIAITGASTADIGTVKYQAIKFTAGSNGQLPRVDINISNIVGSSAATGPVVVEIRGDTSGSPNSTIMASSGITASLISTTAAYLTARFVEAPTLVSGTTYWIVVYLQDNGTNFYKWSTTTSTALSKTSIDGGITWTSNAFSFNYKTYIALNAPAMGLIRFYRGTNKYTLFAAKEAAGTTAMYLVNDSTGAVTVTKTGLSASATKYRFTIGNNVVYYFNGFDNPRQWDGTTDSAVAGSPPIAVNGIMHKNILFLVTAADQSRIVYSGIGDPTSWPSVNFLYIPFPMNPDVVTAVWEQQDNLMLGTRRTKYALYGSDISTFVLRQSTGMQGVYSQELVRTRDNAAYLVNDNGAYMFDGAYDHQVSQPVTAEFKAINNLELACSEIFGDHWYIWHATSSSLVNNQCLLYNLTYGSWFFDTCTYVSAACVMQGGPKGSTDPLTLLLGSSTLGAIYKAEQNYNILGRRIDFEWRSKYDADGDVPSPKQGRRIYPLFSAQDSSYNVDFQLDKDFANTPVHNYVNIGSTGPIWGSGIIWGAFTWGRSRIINPRLDMVDEYNWIQVRVVRSGIDTPVAVAGYTKYFRTKLPV